MPGGGPAAPTTCAPSNSTRPLVGWYRPESSASSVVLPDPDGPMIARLRPASTATSVPATITFPLLSYPSPSALSTAASMHVHPAQLDACLGRDRLRQ